MDSSDSNQTPPVIISAGYCSKQNEYNVFNSLSIINDSKTYIPPLKKLTRPMEILSVAPSYYLRRTLDWAKWVRRPINHAKERVNPTSSP